MRTKATIKGIVFFITTILCLFLIGEGLNLMNQPDDLLFTIGASLVPVSVVGALILSQEVVRLVIREYLEKNDINNLNQR
jgi:hypothetical protein